MASNRYESETKRFIANSKPLGALDPFSLPQDVNFSEPRDTLLLESMRMFLINRQPRFVNSTITPMDLLTTGYSEILVMTKSEASRNPSSYPVSIIDQIEKTGKAFTVHWIDPNEERQTDRYAWKDIALVAGAPNPQVHQKSQEWEEFTF